MAHERFFARLHRAVLKALVGIEIEIVRIVGKWKLSQNKEARDRLNAAEELRRRDEEVISTAMRDAAK
jgi:transcriptional regulator